MTKWTLRAGGQLLENGRPMLNLSRGAYGDGAPASTEIDALRLKIVDALNAADSVIPVTVVRIPARLEIAPGEFERSKLAGYDVEPDGFRGGWRARDPEGEELPGPDGLGEDPHPSERAAWEACDRHRMFGSTDNG